MQFLVQKELSWGEYLAKNSQNKWIKFTADRRLIPDPNIESINLDESTGDLRLSGMPTVKLKLIGLFDTEELATSCFK